MAKSIYSPIVACEVSVYTDDTQQTKLLHTTLESSLQESEAITMEDRMQNKAKKKPFRCIEIFIPEGCDSLEFVVTDFINSLLNTNKAYSLQIILS